MRLTGGLGAGVLIQMWFVKATLTVIGISSRLWLNESVPDSVSQPTYAPQKSGQFPCRRA